MRYDCDAILNVGELDLAFVDEYEDLRLISLGRLRQTRARAGLCGAPTDNRRPTGRALVDAVLFHEAAHAVPGAHGRGTAAHTLAS